MHNNMYHFALQLVTQAREADEFMRTHVVQATLTPNNAYRKPVRKVE